MKLEELYPIIGENIKVVIKDVENNSIACYDGRNSIPSELNDEKIYLPIDVEWDRQMITATIMKG